MNKREFIKQLLLVSMGVLISNCTSYKKIALNNRSLVDKESDIWTKIFYYASLAPSGHNTQPWLVILNDNNEFEITVREEAILPAVDPVRRETYLSLGAFLENLMIASGFYGYELNYDVVASNTMELNAIKGRFYKSDSKTALLELITKRRTIREPFLNKPLKVEAVDECLSVYPNCTYYPSSEHKAAFISRLTYEANVAQVNREEAQRELAKWIHWSNKEADKYKCGLTPACLGITGIPAFVVKNTYTEKSVMSSGFKKQTLKIVREQTNKNGGWVVITSDSDSPKDLIQTGRQFQKLFLKFTEKEIAVHPMTQILEEEPYKKEIAGLLRINNPVQFILRVGYLGKNFPEPVSLRRSVDSFLVNKG